MRFALKSTFFTLAIAALVAGCGADLGDSDDEVAFATFNLEADDGGFDPTIASTIAFEEDDPEAFADEGPVMEEPSVDTAIAELGPDADLDRYEIRLVWGQRKLSPDTPPTDWSGAISTNLGAIRVIRTLRFEQNDSVLERTSPQSVEFISRTKPHHDGLRLRLVVPRNPAAAMAGELTIQMGADIDITIPHHKLRHLIRAKRVDDLGNGLAIVAFRHTPCPKGIVAGHWRRLNKRGGVFAGKVRNAKGEKMGRLVGIWGTRKNGDRRFFGLYVTDGKPAGVVRGTWKSLPNGNGGVFRGQWVTKNGEHMGMLRGHYRHAPDVPAGAFLGIWNEKCGADDVPPLLADPTKAPKDLCSADGTCVGQPELSCTGEDCEDTTDETVD